MQVRRLLSAELPEPQPSSKGLAGSLASGAAVSILASAAARPVAAAVTRTSSVLRRSTADDPLRCHMLSLTMFSDLRYCLSVVEGVTGDMARYCFPTL